MKIIVTGGAGFIGSHIVDRLIKARHKAAIIDNLSSGKKENLNKKAKFYKADIQDSKKISEVFEKEKPEVVFHLAAQINVRESVRNPIFDAKVNIIGSLNIINSFIKTSKSLNNKKFIFASTGGAIYGDADTIPTLETHKEFPLSPYGICKLNIEKYLNYFYKVFGLNYVSLRYGNVYGPRQDSRGEAGVVAIFCGKMLEKKQPIINGDGRQTRDFVYVDDVVEANILAMEKNNIGEYNIGTVRETDINTIFKKLNGIIGKDFKEVHGPAQAGEQKKSCLDFSKAKKELGWRPKWRLDGGLRKTAEWFKSKRVIKFIKSSSS